MIVLGFIDGYVYIELLMVILIEFVKVILLYGVMIVVIDLYEIVNVFGEKGIVFMIEQVW